MPERHALLVDANVLIDYLKSSISILSLANRYLGEIHVSTTVLDEVDGLDVGACERLGLNVIEPALAQVMRAAQRKGQLSFRDHLCLIVALEEGFVCLSNDKALRKACQTAGVATLWGLEVMVALVREGAMQAEDVIKVAEKIHAINPLHISKQVLQKFTRLVTATETKDGTQ